MIKLAHVCIESADLDATERFYGCLGLRRQFEFRNPLGLLIGYYLKFDDQTFLEVIRVESVRPEGVLIELHQYDHRSMQRHGGVCLINYVPRPKPA